MSALPTDLRLDIAKPKVGNLPLLLTSRLIARLAREVYVHIR